MERASLVHVEIPPYAPALQLAKNHRQAGRKRLREFIITSVALFVLAVLLAFGFGS